MTEKYHGKGKQNFYTKTKSVKKWVYFKLSRCFSKSSNVPKERNVGRKRIFHDMLCVPSGMKNN